MKDIKAILSDFDLPDETKSAIEREVKANYKTVADYQKKADRITALEEQIDSLSQQAAKLEGAGQEAENLRAQLKAYEDAEAERKAAEAETAKREGFKAHFENALEGRKFANTIVESSVFEQAYKLCSEETGMDAAKAIAAITKDTEGVWINPQQDPRRMPTTEQLSSKKVLGADEKSFLDNLFGKVAAPEN